MKTTATIEMKRMATAEMKRVATAEMNHLCRVRNWHISRPAALLTRVMSFLLGEKLSTAKALHLLNALAAGTCAFLFGGLSLLAQVLFLLWLLMAIWQYRKA